MRVVHPDARMSEHFAATASEASRVQAASSGSRLAPLGSAMVGVGAVNAYASATVAFSSLNLRCVKTKTATSTMIVPATSTGRSGQTP